MSKIKLWCSLALSLATMLLLFGAQPRARADGADTFDPTLLMTDAVMFNSGTMSEPDIQAFLDKWGTGCTGSLCLRTNHFNSAPRAATSWCSAYPGTSGGSTAHVIRLVADVCQVNPQLLLVMLQKEQGLITSTSPTQTALNRAMGFGCPDYQGCDQSYSDFPNQVYSAASRLQQYVRQSGSFNNSVGNISTLVYSPAPGCPSTRIYVRSAATAALYNYTPFTPDESALSGRPAAADACATWGNLNVVRLFATFGFGSTTAYGTSLPMPALNVYHVPWSSTSLYAYRSSDPDRWGRVLTPAEWAAAGWPAPRGTVSADYVKYPWSASIYAVVFWGPSPASWTFHGLTFAEWQYAGYPTPRTAGWIAGSWYYRWSTSDETFVRAIDNSLHKLTPTESAAAGVPTITTR